MTEKPFLLDPTAEQSPPSRVRAPRLSSLKDRTIALLDISKARGDVFLDRIAEKLNQQGLAVKRYQKPTFARIAPIELKQEISTDCHAVVEALAD
jgi:hypothetical protein